MRSLAPRARRDGRPAHSLRPLRGHADHPRILVFLGAGRMRQLRSYGLAMAAAIIACIPCVGPCLVLSVPFGIWSVVVLSDGAVRAAFES